MKRVLITDDCDASLHRGLTERGFVCDVRPDITDAETRNLIAAYTGLVINSKIRVDRDMLQRAPLLKFVARLGSGMEVVDRDAAREMGVAAVFSPEGNRNAVAEHALGMLLALANKLIRSDREVRQQIWRREENRGWELAGRTIGIIGFGHTGRAFAKKVACLGMRVLAYDKYLPPGYTAGMEGVAETDLDELIRQAQIISLHLPLTSETAHYADAVFFTRCQRGAVLINTARGACVKTADLIAALEDGQIGGACLDVFENEKPSTYTEEEKALYQRLYSFDQVVLSPHVAGWTVESKKMLASVLLEKIDGVIKSM